MFPQPLPGVTTWAQPGKAVYLADNLTRESVRIGAYDASLPGNENKMAPCAEGLKTLGTAFLKRCMQHESEWVRIDEVGYLESGCEEYLDAIRDLLERKRVAAAVRKQELPFLRELCGREDVFLVDLDRPFGSCGCVIMASGLGRRFGGNQLMADFAGSPLLCRILDATEGLFARRVVVTRHADAAELCRSRGIQVVLHDLPHRSDTVRLGMEAVGSVDGCMFCPADQPLLRRETIAALLLSAVNGPDRIWRPCVDAAPGAPVLFPAWAFPELLTLPEGKGGGWMARKYPDRVAMMEVLDACELMDADTPEALNRLLQKNDLP